MHVRWPRRWVAAAAVAGLIGSACSDAPAEDTADPAPSSSTTTSTTTTVNEPTTTAAPPPTSAATVDCPNEPPVQNLDIDGDGVVDGVWLVDREGGQRLTVCSEAASRSIDLEYAVWYLAVADIEPDGVDELFLGSPGYTDRPEQPDVLLSWLEPGAAELVPAIGDGWRGISISESTGAGCVDVDDDGARELVALSAEVDLDGSAQVAWQRRVSDAYPSATTGEAEGVFEVGRDDAAIDLLTTFSCGDDLVPLQRISPPPAICGEDQPYAFPIAADLDGDGVDDVAVQKDAAGEAAFRARSFGGPAIAVCLSSGATDEIPVGGMGEVFDVGSGPGGAPVIWTGGTSISAAYRGALVVDEGRLRYVEQPDGGGFGLWDGVELWDPEVPRFGASGCADLDGDGTTEFFQVEATIDGDQLVWTRETWSFDGLLAAPGPTDDGSRPLPVGFDPEVDGWGAIADMAAEEC